MKPLSRARRSPELSIGANVVTKWCREFRWLHDVICINRHPKLMRQTTGLPACCRWREHIQCTCHDGKSQFQLPHQLPCICDILHHLLYQADENSCFPGPAKAEARSGAASIPKANCLYSSVLDLYGYSSTLRIAFSDSPAPVVAVEVPMAEAVVLLKVQTAVGAEQSCGRHNPH